jgi:hypothetical protein
MKNLTLGGAQDFQIRLAPLNRQLPWWSNSNADLELNDPSLVHFQMKVSSAELSCTSEICAARDRYSMVASTDNIPVMHRIHRQLGRPCATVCRLRTLSETTPD